MSQRRGGIIFLKVDGEQWPAKGNFSYGLGKFQREAILESSGVGGYKESSTVPFIEGEITDRPEISLDAIAAITDATVILELANDKVIALRNAWSVNSDGLTGETDEGNIKVRFEGLSAEEIR